MSKGSVILVGAGCSSELLTIAGREALLSADVVVYDDLLSQDLLYELDEGVKKIYVGKRKGAHSASQDEINTILLREVKLGQTVVRLKGGDSFVFGRGGEEILALQDAGIPYEVIPGISSSIAVPEHLGIPVTHRGVARGFTVQTGHFQGGETRFYTDKVSQTTRVFLMGISHLREITTSLLAEGMDGETPASVLCCGYSPEEMRLDGTLENIADVAKDAPTPGILVVGAVAGMDLRTVKERKPSVTITGTSDFTARLQRALKNQGMQVSAKPYLVVEPMKTAITSAVLQASVLVFTSGNGVRIFFEKCREERLDLRQLASKRIACIGNGTAKILETYGFYPDYMPEEYTAKVLGKCLASSGETGQMLLLRAASGSPELPNELQKAGIDYVDLPLYDTRVRKDVTTVGNVVTDYLVFASASGVRGFFHLQGEIGADTKVICIGEATAEALRERSAVAFQVCQEHSVDGICREIRRSIEEK